MPQDNSTAWVQTTGDKVQVGQTARVVQKYEKVTVTYEGPVTWVGDNKLKVGDPAHPMTCWKCDSAGVKVTIYVQPPQLPKKPGTIIKAYDVRYMEEAAFCLGDDGQWWNTRQGRATQVTAAELAAWGYEILFEPER